MREPFVALVVLLLASTNVAAEVVDLPSSGRSLVLEQKGAPNSDQVWFETRLLDESGAILVKFPPLSGPVLVSKANAQIFSCEANSTVKTDGATAYDFDGQLAFSFPHAGFLRSCGQTDDETLYWLHYNAVRDSLPSSTLVVLDSSGRVVFEKSFSNARSVDFRVGDRSYSVEVPAAELPG